MKYNKPINIKATFAPLKQCAIRVSTPFTYRSKGFKEEKWIFSDFKGLSLTTTNINKQ